jgi:FixJ family two-component response regulator
MDDKTIVAVVDDDPAVLASVRALLGAHGYLASCFSTAEDFLQACPLDAVGCVIADLRMPGIDGGELQRQLADAESTLSVVVVTGHADVPTTVRLMENGAVTLLEKPYKDSALLRAVERGTNRSRAAHARWQRQAELSRCLSQLTDEERQVMEQLLRNQGNKSIGFELGISLRTVDRRRKAVLGKMQAGSVPELAAMLAGHRLGEPSAHALVERN